MTTVFRPQSWSGKFKLKDYVGKYHWYERRHCDNHILRVGGQLHYLCSHAPYPIRKKWKITGLKFFNRYKKLL